MYGARRRWKPRAADGRLRVVPPWYRGLVARNPEAPSLPSWEQAVPEWDLRLPFPHCVRTTANDKNVS